MNPKSWQFGSQFQQNKPSGTGASTARNSALRRARCYNCGQTGCHSKTCPLPNGLCFNCFGTGHKSKDCPKSRQEGVELRKKKLTEFCKKTGENRNLFLCSVEPEGSAECLPVGGAPELSVLLVGAGGSEIDDSSLTLGVNLLSGGGPDEITEQGHESGTADDEQAAIGGGEQTDPGFASETFIDITTLRCAVNTVLLEQGSERQVGDELVKHDVASKGFIARYELLEQEGKDEDAFLRWTGECALGVRKYVFKRGEVRPKADVADLLGCAVLERGEVVYTHVGEGGRAFFPTADSTADNEKDADLIIYYVYDKLLFGSQISQLTVCATSVLEPNLYKGFVADSGFSRFLYLIPGETEEVYSKWQDAGLALSEIDKREHRNVGTNFSANTSHGEGGVSVKGYIPYSFGKFSGVCESLEPPPSASGNYDRYERLLGELLQDRHNLCTMRPKNARKFFAVYGDVENNDYHVRSESSRRDVFILDPLAYLQDGDLLKRVSSRVNYGENFETVFAQELLGSPIVVAPAGVQSSTKGGSSAATDNRDICGFPASQNANVDQGGKFASYWPKEIAPNPNQDESSLGTVRIYREYRYNTQRTGVPPDEIRTRVLRRTVRDLDDVATVIRDDQRFFLLNRRSHDVELPRTADVIIDYYHTGAIGMPLAEAKARGFGNVPVSKHFWSDITSKNAALPTHILARIPLNWGDYKVFSRKAGESIGQGVDEKGEVINVDNIDSIRGSGDKTGLHRDSLRAARNDAQVKQLVARAERLLAQKTPVIFECKDGVCGSVSAAQIVAESMKLRVRNRAVHMSLLEEVVGEGKTLTADGRRRNFRDFDTTAVQQQLNIANRKRLPQPPDVLGVREQQIYYYLRNLSAARGWKINPDILREWAQNRYKAADLVRMQDIIELLLREPVYQLKYGRGYQKHLGGWSGMQLSDMIQVDTTFVEAERKKHAKIGGIELLTHFAAGYWAGPKYKKDSGAKHDLDTGKDIIESAGSSEDSDASSGCTDSESDSSDRDAIGHPNSTDFSAALVHFRSRQLKGNVAIVDRGPENIGPGAVHGCNRLGYKIFPVTKNAPRALALREKVNRLFKSAWAKIRKDPVFAKLPHQTLVDLVYDIYNETPQTSLGGKSPSEVKGLENFRHGLCDDIAVSYSESEAALSRELRTEHIIKTRKIMLDLASDKDCLATLGKIKDAALNSIRPFRYQKGDHVEHIGKDGKWVGGVVREPHAGTFKQRVELTSRTGTRTFTVNKGLVRPDIESASLLDIGPLEELRFGQPSAGGIPNNLDSARLECRCNTCGKARFMTRESQKEEYAFKGGRDFEFSCEKAGLDCDEIDDALAYRFGLRFPPRKWQTQECEFGAAAVPAVSSIIAGQIPHEAECPHTVNIGSLAVTSSVLLDNWASNAKLLHGICSKSKSIGRGDREFRSVAELTLQDPQVLHEIILQHGYNRVRPARASPSGTNFYLIVAPDTARLASEEQVKDTFEITLVLRIRDGNVCEDLDGGIFFMSRLPREMQQELVHKDKLTDVREDLLLRIGVLRAMIAKLRKELEGLFRVEQRSGVPVATLYQPGDEFCDTGKDCNSRIIWDIKKLSQLLLEVKARGVLDGSSENYDWAVDLSSPVASQIDTRLAFRGAGHFECPIAVFVDLPRAFNGSDSYAKSERPRVRRFRNATHPALVETLESFGLFPNVFFLLNIPHYGGRVGSHGLQRTLLSYFSGIGATFHPLSPSTAVLTKSTRESEKFIAEHLGDSDASLEKKIDEYYGCKYEDWDSDIACETSLNQEILFIVTITVDDLIFILDRKTSWALCYPLKRFKVEDVQVGAGKYCGKACRHQFRKGLFELNVDSKIRSLTTLEEPGSDTQDSALRPEDVKGILGVRGELGYCVQAAAAEFSYDHNIICRGSLAAEKRSLLSEINNITHHIRQVGETTLVIRYRFSGETKLLLLTDCSFQGAATIRGHGESWKLALENIANIEAGLGTDDSKEEKIRVIVLNQKEKLHPLLSYTIIEYCIPSDAQSKAAQRGEAPVDIEASLLDWGVTAAAHPHSSSYSGEAAGLARFIPKLLWAQDKLRVLHVDLESLAGVDNIGLCKKINRRSGITTGEHRDFRNLVTIKSFVDFEGLLLAFVTDRLNMSDVLNKRAKREKFELFQNLKRGWLRVWTKGDKRAGSWVKEIGKSFSWERF